MPRKFYIVILIFIFSILTQSAFAQVSNNDKVVTQVGNPSGPKPELNPNADLVAKMVNLVNSNLICIPIINRLNSNFCFSLIDSLPNSQKVIAEFNRSLRQNSALQCVGFVDGAVALVGYPPLPPQGYAYQYARNFLPNYRYISKGTELMQAGDIPIWNPNPGSPVAGHIAYTVRMQSNNEFTVADANYCSTPFSCGRMQIRTENLLNRYLLGWLRKI